MKLTFSRGSIFVTPHDLVIKFNDDNRLTLKAALDTITLYQASCVIAVQSSGVEWSMKLDNEAQLKEIAHLASIEVL